MRMATPRPAWTLVAIALVAACSAGSDDLAETDNETDTTATTIGPPGTGVGGTTEQIFTSSGSTDVAAAATSAVTTSTTQPPPTATPAPTTTATATTTTIAPAATIAPATTVAPVAPRPDVQPTDAASPCPPTGARVWDVHPAANIPAPPLPAGWRTESAGTSVQGRDLTVYVRPVDAPVRTVMVIGGIHGNEPVSPPTVHAMVAVDVPPDTEVWLLPLLNPDGSAVGTRCNANGVDLNRNFSWRWRAVDGGPAAFSEPEPAAAAALVQRVEPDLVVWVHQPLGYVSSVGNTPDIYEQTWAKDSGVPVRPDVTQHGGGESWTALVAGLPSMLIEVDTYDARPDMVAAHVAGFAALLEVVVPR